ncbi:MAG TPA: hypothetical protein VM347_31695, partial [Nonomuraea sp.]|nr:hypothetical protein [Nonomuraea sp.]
MRVLQFAKQSVMTVALACVTLAGCGGESTSDAPFNPSGTNADLDAMNNTFASPTFASFSTFSLMFDAALGGAPLIATSTAALNIRGKSTEGMRAAAIRTAQRLAAIMPRDGKASFNTTAMSIPTSVAGKTFVYNSTTAAYEASDAPLLDLNTVRFTLYEVDPGTFAPVLPLVETGYVDLIDRSAGTTQAAQVLVVAGGVTYIDYTVSASTTTSYGRVTVVGHVTDGVHQANINLRSTLTFTAGLTLTYSLTLPDRNAAINLTVSSTDIAQGSPITINLTMRGPNGTIILSGQLAETSGTINVRVSGVAFATITTNGTTTIITRVNGAPLADDEYLALNAVFEVSAGAFFAFDQMLAPVGAMFDEP